MKTRRTQTAWVMILTLLLGMLAVPNGAQAASGKVKVKKVAAVSSLTGSKTIYLAQGKKATLKTTVTVTPDKAANRKVAYKSSDEKIATVTGKGVITGKKAGSAKITVTAKKDSKKKATVKVKVVKGKVTGIRLNETTGTLTVGDTVKLKAEVKTSKGGKKDVVWTSSDEKVATVKKGTVTAVSAGNAVITVTAADGSGVKATYKLTVKEAEKTTENPTTTEKTTEEATTTEKPATTEENPTPEDMIIEGKNASDVAILQKIIKAQNELGAEIPTDLNDTDIYTWDAETGRLTGINWADTVPSEYYGGFQGELSFEGLTALTYLNCARDAFSGLDVSDCTALTFLSCAGNDLTDLDVSGCTALTELYCHMNYEITNLDVSSCTALTVLDCGANSLTNLDVSKNAALTELSCYQNNLTNLDVSNNMALTRLSCPNNKLIDL
ncbi:MAG: Ig-like domain-containing protein, partial [Clostridium sp.]|nr:Ig-like domain-containing protein [Clostridium sp.]